jgi:hypothetical protein
MNIQDTKSALRIITANGGVPFILGQPGVGKSDTVKQFAQEQAKALGLDFYEGPENYDASKYGFFDLRLATVDSIDLNVLPLIDSTAETTQFTRSPYIAKEGYGVLFLDEIPQAKAGNQAAVSQLILDKRVGTHELGPNWVIVTAGNRAQDRAATHKMPTHIANRLTALDLEFNLDQFVGFMEQNKVHPAAIAFAKWRPDVLESFSPDEDVNCTPRSFVAASKLIDAPDEIQFSVMSGTIGEGATAEFIGFSKIYMNLPEFQEFVDNPTKIKIPYNDPSVMFATIQMLSHNVSVSTINQISKFIDRLSDFPEKQVSFYTAAGTRDISIIETAPFIKFVNNNKDLII